MYVCGLDEGDGLGAGGGRRPVIPKSDVPPKKSLYASCSLCVTYPTDSDRGGRQVDADHRYIARVAAALPLPSGVVDPCAGQSAGEGAKLMRAR